MVVIVNYPCKQMELISVARIGWLSFKNQNADFTAKKEFYKPPYYDLRIGEVDAAEKFDDYSVRLAKITEKRLFLEKKQIVCLNKWQDLKSYIQSAWEDDEAVMKAKFQQAGSEFYADAVDKNWESVADLMKTGETFITENTTALSANNNMPGTFASEFSDVKKELDDAMKDFYTEEENESKLGDKKIDACNLVYKKLMGMFADGQKYFRNDESVKSQFIFDNVLKLVTNKLASLKGHITTNVMNDNLLGFSLSILQNGEEVKTDDEGKYDFGSLAAGTYTVEVSKTGYVSQTINNVVVETGTAKTLNIVMIKE